MLDLRQGHLRWRETHPSRKRARVLALVAFGLFLAVPVAQDPVSPLMGFGIVAVFATGVLGVLGADTDAPVLALLCAVALWLARVDLETARGPAGLAGAVLLLGYHVLITMSAHGPHRAQLPRASVARWLRRSLLLAAGTSLSWGIAHALVASPATPDPWWRVIAGTALVVLAVATAARAKADRAHDGD